MITRADVADLREGDVVRLKWELVGVPGVTFTATGPLAQCYGVLAVGGYGVRTSTGAPARPSASLTVVSRAPRPLYVNSDRTEPAPGDVVRDADDDRRVTTWTKNAADFSHEWLNNVVHLYEPRVDLPDRLLLLVDGTTGLPPAVTS